MLDVVVHVYIFFVGTKIFSLGIMNILILFFFVETEVFSLHMMNFC